MEEQNKGKKPVINDLAKLSEIKTSILGRKLIDVAREFNVSIKTITDLLKNNGRRISENPMEKIMDDDFRLVTKEYQQIKSSDQTSKEAFFTGKQKDFSSNNISKGKRKKFPEAGKSVKPSKSSKKKQNSKKKKVNVLVPQRLTNDLVKEVNRVFEKNETPMLIVKYKEGTLSKIAEELHITVMKAAQFLRTKGYSMENNPIVRITEDQYNLLSKEFQISTNEAGHCYFINLDQDKVILNDQKSISISNLNLPSIITRFNKPVSWLIKVHGFRKETSRLFAEIISFHKGFKEQTQDQIRDNHLLNSVRVIGFKNIDLSSLLLSCSGNQSAETIYPHSGEHINNYRQKKKPEIESRVSETLTIPFKDLEFKTGRICFKKRLWLTGKLEELEIINPHILKEFDPIKKYFKNALGIEEIKVEVKVKNYSTLLSIKNIVATSSDIDKINENLISIIRINLVKAVAKDKNSSRSSYTVDKIFNTLDDSKIESGLFYSEQDQLLDDILVINKTKHYSHLKYLSSRQSLSYKLRFLFKPFSFIFLLDGKEKSYVVWETLDTSEATYVWPIENTPHLLEESFNEIESTIISIKEGGKTKYIANPDQVFRRIYHNYSEAENGFYNWRLELDSFIK